MRLGIGRWVGLIVVLGLPSLAPAQFGTPVLERGKAPVALLRQSWIEDVDAGRLLGTVGRYSPDATFMKFNGTHVEGAEALREFFVFEFAHFGVEIHLTSRALSDAGDLAYDSGSWVETLTDVATHVGVTSSGDYLTVYRRMSGNRWLIVQQAFTSAGAGVR